MFMLYINIIHYYIIIKYNSIFRFYNVRYVSSGSKEEKDEVMLGSHCNFLPRWMTVSQCFPLGSKDEK